MVYASNVRSAPPFDLRVGPIRVRVVDLPEPEEGLAGAWYGAFAHPPSPGTPDLTVTCHRGRGTVVPLPGPGGATRLEVTRAADGTVEVRSHWQDGKIDTARGDAVVVLTDLEPRRLSMSFENFLRVAAQLVLLEHGAFLLHASAVVERGRAVAFFGPSGAGKSTAAGLLAPRPMLTDDMIVVDARGPRPRAATVPFRMRFPAERRHRDPVPLAALLRLRQAGRHQVSPLPPARAVATVSASVPYVHELGLPHAGLTDLVARVAGSVFVGELDFRRDAGFWSEVAPLLDSTPP